MEHKATASDVLKNAIALLGYTDSTVFDAKAIAAFNKVIFELNRATSNVKVPFISALKDEINYPQSIVFGIMPLGIAEQLALSEGDGEQQQYFAIAYERAKAKLNRIDNIEDIIPEPEIRG